MAKDSLPVLTGELVDVAVHLDKEDVAAILMSRAEEHLKGEIGKCRVAEKAFKGELKELEKTRETQFKTIADTHFQSTAETLKAAASDLKAKSVEVTTTNTGANHKGGRGKGGVVHCTLNVTGDRPDISWSVRQDAPFTPELRTTCASIKTKEKDIASNNKVWMDLRRKLADLPSLERRAKAAVAEQRLLATDDGRALVAMLEAQLDDSIKLLGVN